MNYPKPLRTGATVGLICPSSPISPERAAQCRAVMEQLGFRVKMADNLTHNQGGYMAGDGQTRSSWINRMFADPEVEAIFCIRGGYGGIRALENLDLDLIKANPKIFVGYSDVTSFHLLFNQQCGLVTFHGPMVSSNLVDDLDEDSKCSLFQALCTEEAYQFKNPAGCPLQVLQKGRGAGPLVGGNLSLLCASLATPYEVDTRGKIFFIEEVGETVSRMDRLVYQLKNAGKFQDCAGILLGQFTQCPNENMPDYTELQLFQEALEGIAVPVLYNIQSGHGNPNLTLPLGAHCTVDTSSTSICFDVQKTLSCKTTAPSPGALT
ncbi:LD-carboxypeptidase [Aminipila butyrica]|uniref:LD-carboxypeptidase n=1 Tax=Aminipila butyrica TaxID=433296 RepID=A0A858BVI8_9FIRM|nr:LD-carboxypeptidase [Aminipila butyrica]QIB68920.1 LD-carboxypeptidase [Aminipila butyrica]